MQKKNWKKLPFFIIHCADFHADRIASPFRFCCNNNLVLSVGVTRVCRRLATRMRNFAWTLRATGSPKLLFFSISSSEVITLQLHLCCSKKSQNLRMALAIFNFNFIWIINFIEIFFSNNLNQWEMGHWMKSVRIFPKY